MRVLGPGRGIGGLMERLRFGKTEYQLIWSHEDPKYIDVKDFRKFRNE